VDFIQILDNLHAVYLIFFFFVITTLSQRLFVDKNLRAQRWNLQIGNVAWSFHR